MQGTRQRRGPARLPPVPLGLTYPGLAFQLSVQTGALELLNYLGNDERQIRLLLQHRPALARQAAGTDRWRLENGLQGLA